MKIPETSANIGAYYGNEENGQWQPNGVIIDSGVGGGVVGSGDAGVHRPPMYPVHVRPHIPAGYVVPAYYPGGGGAAFGGVGGAPLGVPPAAPPPDDFADYMWMEHEEEFDKQVMQQLEEEALMEQCIEAMLEDEQRELRQQRTHNGHHRHCPVPSNGAPVSQVSLEEAVSRSTLNPLAAEFVPTRRPQPTEHADDSADSREGREQSEPSLERCEVNSLAARLSAGDASAAMDCLDSVVCPRDVVEQANTEMGTLIPALQEPPEVSAADVIIDTHTPKKESKANKVTSAKSEGKRKPVSGTKSEAKIQSKSEPKKEKEVSSEQRREEKSETNDVKPQQLPPPAPTTPEEPASTGPKPINYAAAARANKAKKPTAPVTPTTQPPAKQVPEKQTAPKLSDKPSVTKVVEKTASATKIAEKTAPKIVEKTPAKSEIKIDRKAKPVQRKNSAK